MPNILPKYRKTGVVTTGTDNVMLDTPTFEIINVQIDTLNGNLIVEILHTVTQGTIEQTHSRTFDVPFASLTGPVRTTGKNFLDAIEARILALPQYSGSTKLP
jgi:hypothetical protein